MPLEACPAPQMNAVLGNDLSMGNVKGVCSMLLYKADLLGKAAIYSIVVHAT